jgi:hypothetical protein
LQELTVVVRIFASDFHENELTDFCEHFCKNTKYESFHAIPIKDCLALLSILAV